MAGGSAINVDDLTFSSYFYYNPGKDSWSSGSELPKPMHGFVLKGGKIPLLYGGSANSDYSGDSDEEYALVDNSMWLSTGQRLFVSNIGPRGLH